ncbi:cutinase family protein [Hoyosella altamirensis]|uniref:Cutinase n=1 Tax=Hoyosella altamirensis TaxID=616997 RepID=A0A839RHI7_9ACTN|nr:cutinase family protein [Hoyosella altamirensis]MBB3035847.1 hypothetical protein [Hoyosella altamirensis]
MSDDSHCRNHHPLLRQRLNKAMTAGMMMALVAIPTAAANPPSDPDTIPEHAEVVERTAQPLGADCEPLYVLATRGSNEPPQDGAVIYEDPVYPAGVETSGMGPLLNEFHEALTQELTARGEAEPSGFGVAYPAVRVGEGWFRYPTHYRDSVAEGAESLRESLQQINALCTDGETEVVLAGVSQGADVINQVLGEEVSNGSDDLRNVTTVVLFGDPSRSSDQSAVHVGATRGEGFFRMFPMVGEMQDEWMRNHPGAVISLCIPGDNVCNPLEHPQDSSNALGLVGVSPFARHESYHDSDIELECSSSSASEDNWLTAKECAVQMVADRVGSESSVPQSTLAQTR